MTRIEDHTQWARGVLRHETADWTPQCPDPETLLGWLEQGDGHPEATQLLDHLFSCAHCRQQRLALREIRALSGAARRETVGQIDPSIRRALPAKVERWVRQLSEEGMTAPIASVRSALDRLSSLVQPPETALARSHETPADLRPARTAVRTGRPMLRWSAVQAAQEYKIAILQPVGRNKLRSAWEGSAGSELQLTLPEEAGLAPGSYLWQVVALKEHRMIPSALVGFVVLGEPMRQEIEAMEQEIGNSPLALIGLYEAYGLHEKALEQTDTLIQLNADDETAHKIHAKLLQRISAAPHPPA